ncbi:hypothetical protein EZV73_21890 [Acidaminobacter sp. JC074]|uniref:hypothetical protein n=1 Tax=Acidaminobacter sp. JC074 TaxID=2530199 RepID=UPI001F0D0357|nr:hypothetical protein [Acidaminobacter sp. JC074]MCH4890249.1 hypothetical protein [Acidaminobacter sp. JC074]
MKKLVIGLLLLSLTGCQSGELEALQKERDQLLGEVEMLKENRLDLMDQIKTISEEKMVYYNDNETLKADLEACEDEKQASILEKDALEKSLEDISTNAFEAQYNFDVQVMQTFDGQVRFMFEPSAIPHAQLYILLGDKPELNNLTDANNETITFGDNEYEVVSFQVEGSVYSFKWSNIEWNESFTEYEIAETIKAVDEVNNQRINIHTVLPEGLPSQVVEWKNSKGQVFSVLLGYDGVGFEGTIIECE